MMPNRLVTATFVAALAVPLVAQAAAAQPTDRGAPDTLRAAAPEGFVIGSAVAGGGHHSEQPYPDPFTSDAPYRDVLASEFSSVSAENQMKWEYLHPERDRYEFGMADAIVSFAEQHGQAVRGHTLLWHSQNPEWLDNGDFSADELREILREHIMTVVGRYAGRIQQWDVANEIFDDSGNLRTAENIWLRELGPTIIADAFRWAHEADPEAELFFNDFGVEGVNAKSDAYYALIKDLQAQGVPVHGFSAQAHLSIEYGFPADLEENLRRFDELGLATAITELDVRMILPDNGVPTDAQLAQQADYYRRTLVACLNVDGCDSFTIWGCTDKYSWVPVTFPEEGAATVMWDGFVRKPAYFALRDTLAQTRDNR
ncbi:endo-1,4-beta-xylanase [Saccharopolyspora sp. K220]|uniref:endo-1,4-beta-xylanase n=1 Tax=Saccharopolyspora soli TaxID=2926618 RepID=UPI001F593022|nr:endo-1,4-beta-xylanase [Saccharopolyspora soli]MCI2415941.1 endo-1,4-beta-xylanase [Saccharopolyspora soli]